MSTVGNVVFSFIMMTVSVVLIVESLQEIGTHARKSGNETTEFHVPAILAVTIAFFVKLCLFCYCWGLRNYPQVYSFSDVIYRAILRSGSYIMARS
jgi:protein-S-isoprenylcysteine O-methyltransferase Ste14